MRNRAPVEQDYPAFEIIFVSDTVNDPAFCVIEEARRAFQDETGPVISTMAAGQATDSGQKVHNLCVAVKSADPRSEVFVFTDTDARPQRFWLRSLVAPLHDETLGAATGYRWFISAQSGLASHLLSVWNASIASALGAASDKNFCWGGSTAIRRDLFQKLRLREAWRGTVSDDFTITRVLQDAGLPIKFVPQCITPSLEDSTFRQLFEFTTRQLKITRVYAPHLWKAVLLGSSTFTLAFFGGLVLVAIRAASGLSFTAPLFIAFVIFALGAMKSDLRLRAVALVISNPKLRNKTTSLAHVMLWPIASGLYLYNAVAADFSRRIAWRGIGYELKSATETVILSRESDKL